MRFLDIFLNISVSESKSLPRTKQKNGIVGWSYQFRTANRIKLKFFEALPERFDRQTYLETATELGIKEKATEKYICQFKLKLLDHEHHQ